MNPVTAYVTELLTERLNQLLAALTELQDHVKVSSHASSLVRVYSTMSQVRDSLTATDLAEGTDSLRY